MGAPSKGLMAFALLIIALGTGWLLMVLEVEPALNWAGILFLGMMGLLTFVLSGGIDKASIVIGPLLLLACGLSVLRQLGCLAMEIEVPILVIAFGLLILIAQRRFVRLPDWYVPLEPSEQEERSGSRSVAVPHQEDGSG